VNSRDAELHLTQGTAGSGIATTQSFDANTGALLQILAGPSNSVANLSYGWDTVGNLTSRSDTYEGYTEQFCYDALNRLTNVAMGASCTSSGTKTVGYDAIGDISSKTGVGTYSYPTSGSSSVRPHAVSSITGTVNGVVNPTFTYDANGNMTAGLGRTITPTSYNMATSVVQGSTSICLSYDSEHNRIVQVQTTASCASPGSSASTTTYLNDSVSGSMSEKFVSGSSTTWRDYIAADNGLVAERFNTGGTVTVNYVVSDHLGSTGSVTDSSGTVIERNSFDAWGLRRNANGTDASTCNSVTSQITRGFTGQEHIDATCAINMNARLYDPSIGRFFSADSIVSNALNGQSFNRFSYVNNNPLNAIDPTGHLHTGTPNDDGFAPEDPNDCSSCYEPLPPDPSPYCFCGGSRLGSSGDDAKYGGVSAVYGAEWLGFMGGGLMGNLSEGGGGLSCACGGTPAPQVIGSIGDPLVPMTWTSFIDSDNIENDVGTGWRNLAFYPDSFSFTDFSNFGGAGGDTNGGWLKLLPHGLGVTAGAEGELGVPWLLGGGATGSAGGGLFFNGTNGLSGALFAGGGTTAYATGQNVGLPAQGSSPNVLGASAGAGASVFFTNATSVGCLPTEVS